MVLNNVAPSPWGWGRQTQRTNFPSFLPLTIVFQATRLESQLALFLTLPTSNPLVNQPFLIPFGPLPSSRRTSVSVTSLTESSSSLVPTTSHSYSLIFSYLALAVPFPPDYRLHQGRDSDLLITTIVVPGSAQPVEVSTFVERITWIRDIKGVNREVLYMTAYLL